MRLQKTVAAVGVGAGFNVAGGPGPVEQDHHAVRKVIKEGAAGVVFFEGNLRSDRGGVIVGQHAVHAQKTHEGWRETDMAQAAHRRCNRSVWCRRSFGNVGVNGECLDLTGRKAQCDAVFTTQYRLEFFAVRSRIALQP